MYVDKETKEYIKDCIPNFSEFMRVFLKDMAEASKREHDDNEWEAIDVRERVLKMQREALEKEIMQLQHIKSKLDNIIEERAHTQNIDPWKINLHRVQTLSNVTQEELEEEYEKYKEELANDKKSE